MSVISSRKAILLAARRQYIMDAIIPLIETHPIGAISMEDIAKAASYTKKTLYAYFKSREEIFFCIYNNDLKKRWQYQQEEIKVAETGMNKLIIWSYCFYDFCKSTPHFLKLQNHMSCFGDHQNNVSSGSLQSYENTNTEIRQGLANILQLGIQDSSLRADIEVDLIMDIFLESYRSILNRSFSKYQSDTDPYGSMYVNHYLKLFLDSLAP